MNIPEGYRIYMGGIGTEMPLAVIVQPAKGRTDWAMLSDRQDEQLGEEGNKLLDKFIAITQKFKHKNGMMRPDLGYSLNKYDFISTRIAQSGRPQLKIKNEKLKKINFLDTKNKTFNYSTTNIH